MKEGKLQGLIITAILVGIVALVLVAIWQGLVIWLDLPKILLPTPYQVMQAAWLERTSLIKGAFITGFTALISLFVALAVGGILSILFSQSPLIHRAFFPYVIFLQTVPIVAIAPLLIIWSGYTFRTAVIATVIICVFPIINNITTGLLAVRRDHHDLFQLYGVGRIKRMLRLQIPGSIPHAILGLRISSGLATVGAIVAEFFVGNGTAYEGLGTLITRWQGLGRTDALLAAVFISAVIGLLLFGLVQLLSVTALRRWTSNQ